MSLTACPLPLICLMMTGLLADNMNRRLLRVAPEHVAEETREIQ